MFYVFNFVVILTRFYRIIPQVLDWIPQTLLFDFCHFFSVGEVPPRKVGVEKVHDHEIEAPKIVSTGKVFFEMGIETGISHRTSKLCLFSLVDGSSVLEVLFGETKVYDEYLATDIPFTNDKV